MLNASPGDVGDLSAALGLIPSSLFVLTAAHDDARAGTIVSWVQRCSCEPPMIAVAMRKGSAIAPLIRDGHGFALCQIACDDKFLARKFGGTPNDAEDPFLSTPTRTSPAGYPVVERALSFLDCELVRHVDIESDFELYVGLVRHAEVFNSNRPTVLFGNDD